jgi:hypothetical protein
MVKQIIKEAMNQNPLGLKEAVEEELRRRMSLALEARMKMAEEDDEDEDDDEDDEDDEDEDEGNLDEISKKTLASYVKKAIKSKDMADRGVERAKERLSGPADSGTEFDKKVLVTRQRTSQNRAAGIARASTKK